MNMRILTAVAIAGLSFSLAATPTLAETKTFAVDLTGAAEVPPVTTEAKGKIDASLDTETKVLTWTVTYEGLSGPATMAHFHGPAAADANAPPVVPITGDLASGFKGEATLTDAQITELEGGMWYFNIHTDANQGGEIRGQLTAGAM